jgi:predicted metal-binding membrane protein
VVSPFVLAAGYVAVWLGFALVAASLQAALMRAGLLDGGRAGWLLSGAIFVGAGAYQFSSLKQSCLTLCRSPFPFFFANWTDRRAGVFKLGLRQGLACLGCCWAMMLLMFAVGAMNAVWMAALGIVMTAEKLAIAPRIREAIGVVLIGAGLVMVVSSVV